MRRFLPLLFVLLCVKGLRSQSITFTIVNTSGSYSITCANPTLNLWCITNYTAGFATFTLSGPTGTAIGSNFSVNTPGNYTITAFVNSQVNSTQTLAIGINTTAPLSTLTPTTQNITCSFTSVTTLTATANPTTNVTHYFITPQGGSMSVQNYTAMYTPGITGTHTHVLVNDINGCKTSKIFLVNSISGVPSLSLSCPQSFTIGCGTNSVCSVGLVGQPNPPNNPVSYTVLSNASTTNYATNSQNLYQFNTAGTYTAIVHDNNSSCEGRVVFNITTNTTSPSLNLFTSTPTLNCYNPQATLFGISLSSNTSFSWAIPGSTLSPPTNTISVSTLASTSTSVIGTYSFTVYNNVNACSTQTTITLYQNIFPPNVVIGNSGPNALSCSTPSTVLNNQSVSGIPPFTFPNTQSVAVVQWNGPSSPSSSASSYTAFSAGQYMLQAMDLNNGCTASGSYSLSDGKVYPIVNTPAGPPPYCLDPPTSAVDITPILGGAVSNYTFYWITPGSATITGQNTATLSTNGVGVYTVLVTNTVSGCLSTGQLSVTVCTDLAAYINPDSGLNVFPNPSKGTFHLSGPLSYNLESVRVIDSEGRMIREFKTDEGKRTFDLESIKPGLYLLVIRDQLGNNRVLKLLVQ